jgi:plastocyanin
VSRVLGAVAVVVALALAGCSEGVDRTVAIESHDFAYAGLEAFTGVAGERVEFELTNKGPARHEFVVIDPDGMTMGGIAPIGQTETGRKKLELKKPGTYTYACFVDDHLWRDMKGTFEVR